jgi:G:T/U-mismatch repair DNA glycosylase
MFVVYPQLSRLGRVKKEAIMKMPQPGKTLFRNIFTHITLLLCGIALVFSLFVPSDYAEGKTKPIPPEAQIKKLISNTMDDFALAVNARDFSNFYRNISKLWQAQTTKEELYNTFKTFSDNNLDLTVLQDLEPVFMKQPYLTKEGVLVIQGYYPIDAPFKYFELEYVYESPEWKLLGTEIRPSASLLSESNTQIPPEEQLKQLVQKTMLDFALAIKARDFTGFYFNISKLWQSQTTKEELANIFKSFSDQNIDLTVLQELNPIFTKDPQLTDEGVLVLQGNYSTTPFIVSFTLKYIYEKPEWKLFGINVKIKPEEKTEEIPSDDQLKQLVQKTMLDFALAIKARDFTGFYSNIAQLWQARTTKEELANIFKSFSDQNIDLTVLQELNPIFTKNPQLTDEGVLVLQGRYPTKPSVVSFMLKYVSEESKWKLVGINVEIK